MPILGTIASSRQVASAAGMTYISTTTVSGSSTNTVSLSGFGGYDDLMILYSARTANIGNADNAITVNNDSSSIYSAKLLFASGSVNGEAAFSQTNIYRAGYMPYSSMTANYYGNSMIYIHNYASATTNKTIRWEAASPIEATAGFMIMADAIATAATTTAITSVQITCAPFSGANYADGSQFFVYGITR
jgi:hypothetical protein